MSDDILGLRQAGKVSITDKIKTIQPSPPAHPLPDTRHVDTVAEARGFRGREARAALRTREIVPTVAINMRVPESVAIPFMKFCKANRFSYWEGVEFLMKQSNLLD